MLIVEKLPWGNTLEVTRGVEAALEELRPGLPGVQIDTTIFRPATFVEDAIQNLSSSLILGVLLMVLVLALFLYDWRSALISAVTIPLSLVSAWLVLYWQGATINTMVLAGLIIALGAVVDDAIVDVENIIRRLRLHRQSSDDRSLRTTAKIVFNASLEVRGAVVYASLIEALALLPIFFLQGLTGAFFKPLAMAYALAVLVSLVVALIWTPAMGLILLRNAPLDRRELADRALRSRTATTACCNGSSRTPRPAYATVGALMLGGVLVLPLTRPVAAAGVQGTRLPDALADRPGDLARKRRCGSASSPTVNCSSIPGVRNAGVAHRAGVHRR